MVKLCSQRGCNPAMLSIDFQFGKFRWTASIFLVHSSAAKEVMAVFRRAGWETNKQDGAAQAAA